MILDSVQDGTSLVYVLDDTESLSTSKAKLLSTFENLAARHQSTPNVQVAVIKQGGGYSTLPGTVRFKQIYGFVSPGQLLASKIDSELTLSAESEWLESGVAQAQRMINDECPPGADLTSNPWCRHKVIVVLSDGDPGVVEGKHYHSSHDNLPEKLLNSISNDGIVVNTICIVTTLVKGNSCYDKTLVTFIYTDGNVTYKTFTMTAKDRFEKMSTMTGGKYYGVVR